MSGIRFILVLLAIIAAFSGAGYLATRSHLAGWDSPASIGKSLGAWLRGDAPAAATSGPIATEAEDGTIGAFAQDTGRAGGEWLRTWGDGIDGGGTAVQDAEPTLPQEIARDIGHWIGDVPDTEPAPATTASASDTGSGTQSAASSDTAPAAESTAGTTATEPKPADQTTAATVPSAGESAGGAETGTDVTPIPPATSDTTTAAADPTPAPVVAPAFTEMHFDQPSGPIIAGTAAKGAIVSVTVDDAVIATGRADEAGEWTVLPKTPIIPGEHWIGVTARASADSTEEIVGERRLMLVPGPQTAATNVTGSGEVVVGDKASFEAAGVDQDGGTGTSIDLADAGGAETTAATGTTTEASPSTASGSTAGTGSGASTAGTETPPSATPEAAAPGTQGGQEFAQASEMEKEADKYWDWNTWFGDDNGANDGQPGGQTPSTSPTTGTTGSGTGSTSGTTTEGTLATLPDDKISISGVRYTPVGTKEGLVTLSGRGLVGSKVRLQIDEDSLGEVEVAENGRWLKETKYWIAPGPHAARAALIGGDGTIVAEAAYPFSREVPAEGQESTIVATAPQPGSASVEQTKPADALAFSGVRYEPLAGGGRITATGRGVAGSTVKLSVGGKATGASKVAENGRWLIEQPIALALGEHEATVEAIDADGKSLGSVGTKFVAEKSPAIVAATSDGDDQPVTNLQEATAPETAASQPESQPEAGPAAPASKAKAKRSKSRVAVKKRTKASAGVKSAARKKAARIAQAHGKAQKKKRARAKVAAKSKRQKLVQIYVRRGNTIELVQVPAGFVKSGGVLRLKGKQVKRVKVVARKRQGAWRWLKGHRQAFVGAGKRSGRKGNLVTVYRCKSSSLCTARRVRLR